SIKSIVDFEDARAAAITLQFSSIRFRNSISGNVQQLPGRNIQQNQSRLRHLSQITDNCIRPDFAAQSLKIGSKCLGQSLRSATWHGPANGMSKYSEDDRKSGRRDLV